MRSCNYQLDEARMFADVTDGTAIIINSATGVYYGLNEFGTAIYENLQKGSSTGEILSAVESIPGVTDQFESLFESFIASLVGFEILIPVEGKEPRAVVIDPETARKDNFEPLCHEYKDVQELLFADPIHEVDVDEGWKPE